MPATFALPAGVKRDVGWKLWLQGMSGFTAEGENGINEQQNIKTFAYSCLRGCKRRFANVYKIHWQPLFTIMEVGFGDIPQNLTPDLVNELYEREQII